MSETTGIVDPLQRGFSKVPTAWRFCLATWLFFTVMLMAWGAIIWRLGLIETEAGKVFYFGASPVTEGWRGALLGVWQRWDALHYCQLVEQGYGNNNLSVFFPLYPWLARQIHRLTGGEVLASLLMISNVALILALVSLFQLVEALYDVTTAKITIFCLMTYPYAYFLHAPYTESLALFLCVLAYASAQKRRWPVAALAGLAAGLARSTSLPLVLAIGWEAWEDYKSRQSGFKPLPFFAALCPALGITLFFSWRSAQDFTPFSQLQQQAWGTHFAWPWDTLLFISKMSEWDSFINGGLANLFILTFCAGLTAWGYQRLPKGLRIYQVSMLALLILSTRDSEPFGSLRRFSLLLFPMFILLALWANTPRRRLAWFSAGISLQLYLCGQFFMWGWTG